MMGGAPPLIGIDLGGTKIEVAVLAPDGAFVMRERVPTPQGDYAGTLAALAQLVTQADAVVAASDGPRKLPVGIAIPGSLSPASGRVRNANSTVLNGQYLLQDLTQRLARPVRIENDANCLAASEAADGAAAGAKVTFAVILGTGVGAGLAWEGQVWSGLNAVAGEWGHSPLPSPRPDWDELDGHALCWCGRMGCTETWLSGPAWARDHHHLGGERLAAPALVERLRAGDTLAARAFERYADRLARALGQVVNLIDPSVIVLGGGMSRIEELYTAVPARWGAYVFSDYVRTPLRPATYGDSSGVRGAAWLWRQPAPHHAAQSASTGSSD